MKNGRPTDTRYCQFSVDYSDPPRNGTDPESALDRPSSVATSPGTKSHEHIHIWSYMSSHLI